jgi:hypothetical protein
MPPMLLILTSLTVIDNSIALSTFSYFSCITVNDDRVISLHPAIGCNSTEYINLKGNHSDDFFPLGRME